MRIADFMRGRNGFDQLALAALVVSLVLQLIGALTGFSLLLVLSMALYLYAFFRIFSPKSYKREAENQKFSVWWSGVQTKIVQFFRRLKLMRQYKYFKCPQCKALLRLTRGVGEKDICCPKCQNRFKQKA